MNIPSPGDHPSHPPPPLPPQDPPATPAAGNGEPRIKAGDPAAVSNAPAEGAAPAAVDRWAHRRTEPRPLAFLWTTFLAIASALTLATLVAQGATGHDVYRPAARALFAVVAVGLTVLWPMLRLSQATARESSAGAVAKDISVLIAPAQAVLWPQAMFFLADWPLKVIGACAALLAAWTLLAGGVLAIALTHVAFIEHRRQGQTAGRIRAAWTAVIVVVVAIGPILGIGAPPAGSAAGSATDADLPMLASPVTGVLEITSDRSWSGKAALALPAHWRAVGLTFGFAAAVWIAGIPVRRRFRLPAPDVGSGPGEPVGIQTQEKEPLHGAGESESGSGSAEPGA